MAAEFKMSVLWSAWCPQIQTRVLRDVMTLARLATVNRATLIVACDQLLRANVEALGVRATEDFAAPDMCRVYVMDQTDIPNEVLDRVPSNVDPVIVSINGEAVAPNGLVTEEDPYAGVKLYKGVWRIPETMPLDKPAPKGVDPDMPFSPYLVLAGVCVLLNYVLGSIGPGLIS